MVEQLTTRTAKLIPRAKKVRKVPGFATAYHFETDKQLQQERGNLYVAIEVLTAGKQAEAVVDLVIETIGNAYFNTQSRPEQTILSRFEEAVKAVNQALADYTNDGNAGWVGRLSAVLTVLCGEEVHLTQAGSAEAYLYRGNRSSHITADLQTKGMQKPVNTFSNIASGTVLPSDRLIIATPALFHNINAAELKSIVTDTTANGAIQKISDRIGADEDAERTAVVVIEITTPEMLALSTIPDEPEEIHIGRPDTPLEVAKTVAAPAAKTMALKSKELGRKVVNHTQASIMPKAKELGLAAASWLRKVLRQRRSRQVLLAAAGLVLVFGWWSQNNARQVKAISTGVNQYTSSYHDYEQALLLANSDKSAARTSLEKVSKDLAKLAGSKQRKQIEAALAKESRPVGDPSSVEGLQQLVSTEIDRLAGIVTVPANVIDDLSDLGFKPASLEVLNQTYVIIGDDGSVATSAAGQTAAAAKPNNFGTLVATTASSTGDGVYLLSTEPAVWFFNLANKSLVKQTAALDGWVRGKDIASYAGNLYVLSDDSSQVWKYVRASGGFGAKTAYFSGGSPTTDAVALAVDGSVYLAGPSGIRRYTRGSQDQASTDIPESLKNIADISVTGSTVITQTASSSRIGVFNAPDNTINYSQQVTVKDTKSITSLRVDGKAATAYALADGKLISAPLNR